MNAEHVGSLLQEILFRRSTFSSLICASLTRVSSLVTTDAHTNRPCVHMAHCSIFILDLLHSDTHILIRHHVYARTQAVCASSVHRPVEEGGGGGAAEHGHGAAGVQALCRVVQARDRAPAVQGVRNLTEPNKSGYFCTIDPGTWARGCPAIVVAFDNL